MHQHNTRGRTEDRPAVAISSPPSLTSGRNQTSPPNTVITIDADETLQYPCGRPDVPLTQPSHMPLGQQLSFTSNRATPNPVSLPPQVVPTSTSFSSFPIAVPPITPLKFSTVDITLWFHRFNARYHKLGLNDKQLSHELLNCLDDTHIQRISHLLRHQPPSFDVLKSALIKVYHIPAARRQFNLKQVPVLGDNTPSELLSQLRFILGKDDIVDETAKLLFLSEFLNRMPAHVRPILRLFQDKSLDFIACKADALLQNSYSGEFSYSAFYEPKRPQSFSSYHALPTSPAQVSMQPYSIPMQPYSVPY